MRGWKGMNTPYLPFCGWELDFWEIKPRTVLVECPFSPTFQKLVINSWCWATLEIYSCSKAIWGGVWYQNSFLYELEKDWAFPGRKSSMGIPRKSHSFKREAWTVKKQHQSFWCCRLSIRKSRLLNNSGKEQLINYHPNGSHSEVYHKKPSK